MSAAARDASVFHTYHAPDPERMSTFPFSKAFARAAALTAIVANDHNGKIAPTRMKIATGNKVDSTTLVKRHLYVIV